MMLGLATRAPSYCMVVPTSLVGLGSPIPLDSAHQPGDNACSLLSSPFLTSKASN